MDKSGVSKKSKRLNNGYKLTLVYKIYSQVLFSIYKNQQLDKESSNKFNFVRIVERRGEGHEIYKLQIL